MRVCLMSIKPKWAKELYSGKKTVEFRKSSPDVGSLVFLYESAPVKAVTGCFRVQSVLTSNASHVWYAATSFSSTAAGLPESAVQSWRRTPGDSRKRSGANWRSMLSGRRRAGRHYEPTTLGKMPWPNRCCTFSNALFCRR